MVLFNNIPYKRMRITSKVNLTKRFSEKYKRMRLITKLYSMPSSYSPVLARYLISQLCIRNYLHVAA